MSHLLEVPVPDADAQFARAREPWARVLQEATEHEYGERECTIEDLAGHRWQFTQTMRDVAPKNGAARPLAVTVRQRRTRRNRARSRRGDCRDRNALSGIGTLAVAILG